MLKRIFGAVLTAVFLLVQIPAARAVDISASSAILMEADTGRVLYEKNAHQPRLIASITKLMTALVAMESGHELEEQVTIAPEWAGVEGSSIYLQAGEQVTLEALLYGMLLRSGNDAAVSIAGYCGGSVETFVEKMNEKAQTLGMNNTHFANPNGLNDPAHYSSAYDMALLAKACLDHSTLANMVATKSITIGTRIFTNHNKLLWRYEGCVGMKTGYTEKAGRTLVSAAKRDGMRLICVTLNAPNDWADHTALFDFGFANYRQQRVVAEGEIICQMPTQNSLTPFCPVLSGRDVFVCLAGKETVRRELAFHQHALAAPVGPGKKVGVAIYYVNDMQVASVPLVTGMTVNDHRISGGSIFDRLLLDLERLYRK